MRLKEAQRGASKKGGKGQTSANKRDTKVAEHADSVEVEKEDVELASKESEDEPENDGEVSDDEYNVPRKRGRATRATVTFDEPAYAPNDNNREKVTNTSDSGDTVAQAPSRGRPQRKRASSVKNIAANVAESSLGGYSLRKRKR